MNVANDSTVQMDTGEQIRYWIGQLHKIAPGSIGDQLEFQLTDADEGKREYTFLCKTEKWMRNGFGTLHGGMSATILDQAMGFVIFGTLRERGIAPTIQMQQSYHYPLKPGRQVIVKVTITDASKSLFHLRAEAYQEEDPEKLCVSATAIYYLIAN